ncbi:hypothetical protein H0H93_013136 [Arthromyces matolae]|nr:hypothetical protein H0H93_013136 [Arthromyces matolae]
MQLVLGPLQRASAILTIRIHKELDHDGSKLLPRQSKNTVTHINDSKLSNTLRNAEGVELPPDQSQRIVVSKELGYFHFLSVSDEPVYLGKDSAYDDFSAYTVVQIVSESLTFTGDLLSPHGISISCNNITASKQTLIDTSGAAGADQQIGGADAKPGANGGSINFYVQNGSEDVSKRVLFVAKGGKGGDVVVKGSTGGNGGDGGSITRIFQSRYSALLGSIYEFLARKDAQDLKVPVHKGDPIHLAASQLLTVALMAIATEKDITDSITALREVVSDISKSLPRKVDDLVKMVSFLRNPVEDVTDKQNDDFKTTTLYPGGYGGSGKGVPGITGANGKIGSETSLFLTTYNSDISKTTFAFAHPEQCSMLLDRAKVFYYMGSPELLVKSELVLQRIVQRLSFLPQSEKAYTKSDLSKLQSVKTEAANLLMQLATGVSFNGHPKNWAPRGSYTSYEEAVNNALKDHAAFESAYIAYHAALLKQQKLTEHVSLALQRSSLMIANLDIDINELVERLQKTEKLVISLTSPVEITHAVLLEKFKELEDRIKSDEFELSVPQLMNALRSLAFSPTVGMYLVERINLVYEGLTSVPDIDGHPVNRDHIIGKIKRGEATVKSIKDILGQELDGEFKVDDPFGTRIMTAEEDMMSFLESYANSCFADVITQIKEAFDDFVKAMVTRNKQAVLYNIQLRLYVQKIATKQEYESKKKDLQGKQIEISDPNLSTITAYMSDIYQSSRARVMQYLDYLVRSLNFRMLTAYDILHLAFPGTEPDKVPLSITSDVLRSGRSQIQDHFAKELEIWGSSPQRFPSNFDDPVGKRIYINSKSDLDNLSRGRSIVVKIPVMHKTTIQKNDFSGCCNVRIYRVRFGFENLKVKGTEPARVTVTLTHSGKETIVHRTNMDHQFVHDPIKCVYSYNLHPDGSIDVLDNGNISGADVDEPAKKFAAPGPFAEDWTVSLTNSDLTRLDFGSVKKGYFDFCGTNFAF